MRIRFFLFVTSIFLQALFLSSYQCLGATTNDKRPFVGVLQFVDSSFSPSFLKALSQKLQDELFHSLEYQLVEQAEMSKIMEEHSLSSTGCTQTACLVAMVKEVGAEKLLVPSISKIGKITTLSLRIINVATGRIEQIATLDTYKSEEKIIVKDIPILVKRITGKKSDGGTVFKIDAALKLKPVAVLDINGYGIKVEETKGLTSRLRAELIKTGTFEVMEREQMQEILQEQGFQQSGLVSEENVLVQAGQLIGVQQMVGGAVSHIEPLYSVSARLIDVQSGKILRTATADVRGDLSRVLSESMNDMARSLSGLPPIPRSNPKVRASIGGAILFLAAAGLSFYSGLDQYDKYKNESANIGKLRDYKSNTKTKFTLGYAGLGAAGICGGAALYFKINDKVRLKVSTPE